MNLHKLTTPILAGLFVLASAFQPVAQQQDVAGAATVMHSKAVKSWKTSRMAKMELSEREQLADSIIAFASRYLGLDYYYTGKNPETGFDCSGFTSFVYANFDIEVSPASAEQIYAGEEVELTEADKGDLLVFTGTNLSIRQPGHVGIIISEAGELPIRFIHSSSNGGVKISEVQGTRYAERLLQVRRVILPE